MKTMENIKKKREKRRFRKELKRVDDETLLVTWTNYRLIYYTVDNDDLGTLVEMIQHEIYRIKDPKLLNTYIRTVENFGVNKILKPWFVLHEFLLYSFDKNGEKDYKESIACRIKNNNLGAYINFFVFKLMSDDMRKMITEADINYVVELMKPLAIAY